MKDRKLSIKQIRETFPADSKDKQTAIKGKTLLFDAIAKHWESLPDAVLSTYAENCINNKKKSNIILLNG